MSRLKTKKSIIAAVGVLAGLALTPIPTAFARQDHDHGIGTQHVNPNDQVGTKPDTMSSMNDKEMQQKMARMTDDCNRMMESMMQNKS